MPNNTTHLIAGKFIGQDILSLDQFSVSDIKKVLTTAKKLKPLRTKQKPSKILQGTNTTLLFYEPSSRTFGSFHTAVNQLGGGAVAIHDAKSSSSVVKGESLSDTIKTFESYSDAIVMRHPEIGSAHEAARAAHIPIINAGDGGGSHPTQTLLDLYTINEHFGSLDNRTVLCCGDILHSRTIRSLVEGLSLFKGNTVYLLSPKELRLEPTFMKEMQKRDISLIEIHREQDIPKNADVWYWNRIQKERFATPKDAEKYITSFTLTPLLLKTYGNKKMIIMDPLPRVGEIDEAVDNDSRAVYLSEQMRNGVYVRMALLALVLGKL